MQLRDRNGPIPDPWVRVENGQTPPVGARVILTLDRLCEEGPPEGAAALGVHVGADVDPLGLGWLAGEAALVSVGFPSFADGRGFSIARQLRRLGFEGELRASGPVIADQLGDLLAVGFDTVETPEAVSARQPHGQWDAAARSVTLAYQAGYGGARRSIIQARREAGAAESTA